MPAWGLIAGGLGLLGGVAASQQKFRGYGAMNKLINEYGEGSRNLSYFQRLAQDAGPSLNELKSLAAATGGSSQAAVAQSRGMQAQAGDQALNAFGRYRQGIEGLRANLAAQKTSMKFQDFSSRRDSLASAGNQVASAGFGYFANQQGLAQQQDFLKGLYGAGSATAQMPSTINPGIGKSLMNSYNSVYGNGGGLFNASGPAYTGFGIGNRDRPGGL